LHDKS
jgi:hypothetical protein